jgi:Tripartite tricarboxylate transporter TctB family
MTIKNTRDFYAGLMFIIFGVIFIILSQQYNMGTASKMGPAYFPTILGGILVGLGSIVLIGSISKNAPELKVQKFELDIIAYLLGAVALFATLLVPGGFVAALLGLIFLSSKASHEFSLRDTLISVVVLSIASYLVFIKGLQLQMPTWPKFLGL